MSGASTTETMRQQTRAHYDRYPFGFDQEKILEEKLAHRVMGDAIRELAVPGAIVMDIGCGACRVAQLVRRAGKAKAVSLDLSLDSLRAARERNPDPVVNGDNLQLPFKNDCADLVISNGVIHHTPDPKESFMELARITKPGGTLVVAVYNRHSWYYYAYRYVGAVVRVLRRVIGDRGLRVTLFPVFHVATLILLSVATRRKFILPVGASWNLFHDQFTTPRCTFHTFEELSGWAEEAELVCEEQRKEAANQLATLKLRKRAGG
jgi:ubiquinone/menaquinone biosynthesis C-methylase UbiE